MTRFSKDISVRFKNLDYEGTIGNYTWVKESMESIYDSHLNLVTKFSFRVGDIYCTCNSIEEFMENAYGQDIAVFSFEMTYKNLNESGLQVYFLRQSFDKDKLHVSCEDKKTLIKICTLLEKNRTNFTDNNLVQNITNNINDHSTYISIGDNNTIHHSDILTNSQVTNDKTTKGKAFWTPIAQSIFSRIIWIIIIFIIVVVFAYIGIKVDWTSLL